MAKIIKVKFFKQQGDDELYISTGLRKKVFLRRPGSNKERVVWMSAVTDDNGVYEPKKLAKAGVTFQVIMGKKKNILILFEECMEGNELEGPSAKKQEHFASEQLKNAMKELNKKLSLHSYDSWTKWLLNECSRYDYTGYRDNWLRFGTIPSDAVEVEQMEIIGIPYYVVTTQWHHMVCPNTWKVVEIRDAKHNVLELCGYAFEAV